MSSQTFSAEQSPRWDCLCHHITLAHMPGEQRTRFPMKSSVDGMNLQAARVNRFNGQIVRQKVFPMLPDSRVELFASDWPDLFFIVEFDRYRQKWLCSCERELCEHIKAMRGISR